MRLNRTSAPADSTRPGMSVALAPTRAMTRAVMPTEKTPMTRLRGRNAIPVRMALYRSTCWKYSAPMKNALNSPTAKSALIPFATESVRARAEPDRPGGRPPPVAGLDDGEDGERGRRDGQHGADRVDPLTDAEAGRLVDQDQAQDRRHDADRQVDEEDPVPGQCFGQQPAHQEPDRPTRRSDEGVHAHRLRSLPWRWEHGDQDPEDHRSHEGGGRPLHEPRSDQQGLTVRKATEQRGDREGRGAGDEDLLASHEVAQPPGQEHQPPEGQQVGVHDPRQRRLREMQVPLDRGQRDVHDRDVQNDHELADAEHHQGGPSSTVARRPRGRACIVQVFVSGNGHPTLSYWGLLAQRSARTTYSR